MDANMKHTSIYFSVLIFSASLSLFSWGIPTTFGQVIEDETTKASEAASGRSIRFSFKYAAWKDVLEQFAEEANLSLVMATPPPGTFNYSKDKKLYTPAEAIDLMNSVLLTKGYTLLRREQMLMVINVDDGVPPDLLTTIPVEELKNRGKFELVRCMFDVENVSTEEAAEEIDKVKGRLGSIEILPKSKKLLVIETAGKLRIMRDILRKLADPKAMEPTKLKPFTLEHVDSEQALIVLRQMLRLPEGQNSDDEGLLNLSLDPSGSKLLVSGTSEHFERIDEILKLIDVPIEFESGVGIADSPQLEVYSVTDADPESALGIMQTLFQEDESIRLALDPKTWQSCCAGDVITARDDQRYAGATAEGCERNRSHTPLCGGPSGGRLSCWKAVRIDRRKHQCAAC